MRFQRLICASALACATLCAVAMAEEGLSFGPGPVEDVPGQAETDIDYHAPGQHKDTCGASQYQDLVGKAVGLAARLPIGAQYLYPSDHMSSTTGDPSRLNVRVDSDQMITRIWCG